MEPRLCVAASCCCMAGALGDTRVYMHDNTGLRTLIGE